MPDTVDGDVQIPTQPPTTDGSSTQAVPTEVRDGVDAEPRPKTRRRRGTRGGRGRKRPGTRPAGSPEGSPDGEAAVPVDAGEVDAGEVPPEPTAKAAAPDTADGSPEAVKPRRRSRGGRGRGGKGRSQSQGKPTPEEAAVDAEGDATEVPDPEPRPEVALVDASVDADVGDAADAAESAVRRRRRRGGRGRGGRGRSSAAKPAASGTVEAEGEEAALPAEGATEQPSQETREDKRKPATRRTRATRGVSRTKQATEPRDAEPAETKEAAPAGPTRLRRGRRTTSGTSTRRRREHPVVVPRVTDKVMAITEHGERDQIAILEENTLVQHYVTRVGARSMVGNVYLGRVQNVLPGMEAAFVDVGRGRNAVLYAGEVNYSPEDLEGKQAPRIEQVLKSGQSVLVQVTKDPIGGKGARLTAQISMPGRYLVLVPNSNVTGISRRVPDAERRRLKAILKKIRPEGHGVIVRTAAEGADEEALEADVRRVLDEWYAIEKRAKRAKAPAILYEEPELTVRVVRDLFTDEEYRELVTDSERVYTLVTQYLSGVAPDVLPKVRLHKGKLSVFEELHIVEQIHKGLDRKVWLPSGGYLVIDRTEALTVIDVNTGKSVGKTNLEETVVNTNVEAAREVARQLRLRDIGGMIVIDFIDMLLEQNKQRVIDTLREEMAKDKTRSQVFDISPLGLLEVTRKRVSGGLLESFSETCPTCEGRGLIVTYEG
jgi:ribonuclease E